MKKIRVWDLPVRLFHWILVLLIATAVITVNIGGNAMEWHFLAGYASLALILFRLIWGFVGSRYARFSDFFHGPGVIIAYLRDANNGMREKYYGHNPLGSLSVFALLGIVLMQAISGLFSNDDIASEGPLFKFISKELSDQVTWFHKEVSGTLIYILVGLHVAAIAYYYFIKKNNLIKPMLTGDKLIEGDAPSANDSWAMRLLAAAILAACAAAIYYVVNLQP